MIDRRIKFRHIQCFVEIAQERSLKLAADKLSLTQPAISKTLKELEEIIGATLMTRNRAGIALTKQGKVFLHFAQISLASLQQGLDGVEKEGDRARAVLKVGALPSVAASFMPPVIREFSELAPDVLMQIRDGPHGYLIERLKLGELDLVIGRLGRPESMEGVSFTQLYSEQVDLVVRTGHPFLEKPDLKRIVDWPVIYPPEEAAIRPLVERFMIANGVGDIPNKIETVSRCLWQGLYPKIRRHLDHLLGCCLERDRRRASDPPAVRHGDHQRSGRADDPSRCPAECGRTGLPACGADRD